MVLSFHVWAVSNFEEYGILTDNAFNTWSTLMAWRSRKNIRAFLSEVKKLRWKKAKTFLIELQQKQNIKDKNKTRNC